MDHVVPKFKSGVMNVSDDENINEDAAQDSSNWITQDERIKLSYGRQLVGQSGTVGKIGGLHVGYKTDGTTILYRKIGTKIQYLNGNTWTDIITGLTTDSEYTFANYSSLAGAFTFVNGVDGYWKIINANPTSPISMYDSTKNFHGKILINKGRTILWDRDDSGKRDKTGLYGSWIDAQNSTVYTAVTGEAIGSLGSTNYTGTLAFKAGGATRNCFSVSISGSVAAGTETFVDNYDGTLTSNFGGTGTINYATGAYNVTFSDTTTGAVTGAYQWEDSNIHGITDFTYSSTRVAGEGFIFPQDEGGDAILNVVIGQDGAYYSMKSQSAYRLFILETDKNTDATNEVYRKNIGIQNFRAVVSTSKGIVFMNTANPTKPELTILQKNALGDNVEPVILFKHFKFENYTYSDCAIDTYDRYMIVACRDLGYSYNNVILLCDVETGIVDITKYASRIFASTNSILYAGSPITENVYKLYVGFDDDSYPIDNYWIGKGEQYMPQIAERLKKFKKIRLKGNITPTQEVEVYVSYDDQAYVLVGTISGSGSYVDTRATGVIGTSMIGTHPIGGEDSVVVVTSPFFVEFKPNTPKFRKRTIKLVATGTGYVDFDMLMDWNINLFEQRLPKQYRVKET